jgi:hypothetical protein
MATNGWIGKALGVVLAAAILGAGPSGARIRVVATTPESERLATWAVARYAGAGLDLPTLEIRFHDDPTGCRGRLGYYEDGVVDVCHEHLDGLAARTIVHEMAHGWLEANLTATDRERFLGLRGLSTWNDRSADWDARGYEQAAEIMAWAIGDQADGISAPSFANNSLTELAAAYRTLTGRPLPNIEPSMLWQSAN